MSTQSNKDDGTGPVYFHTPGQEHGYLSQWYESPMQVPLSRLYEILELDRPVEILTGGSSRQAEKAKAKPESKSKTKSKGKGKSKAKEETKDANQTEPHKQGKEEVPTQIDQLITYNCTEQLMMHAKSLLFHDPLTAHAILSTSSPRTQKSLGRRVKGFHDPYWRRYREQIVEEANWFKFTQNSKLKGWLLATGDRELVEASPFDRVWGIGFSREGAGFRREEWGENLLGKALGRVRKRLREEGREGGREKERGGGEVGGETSKEEEDVELKRERDSEASSVESDRRLKRRVEV